MTSLSRLASTGGSKPSGAPEPLPHAMLGANFVVFVRDDRSRPLVVMTLAD
jgi:hypothetical protein